MKKVLSLLLMVMLLFTLAVPAMPLEFVPSVQGTEAPEIAGVTDSEGNVYDAIIDLNGEEIGVAEGEEIELEVTVVSEVDEAPSEEVAAALIAALEQVHEAETVADLVPQIIEFLENTGYEVEDFIVSDLFDASLVKNGEVIEVPTGATVKIRIKTDLKPGEPFFLLHNYEGNKWEIVANATLEGDGYVTAVLNSLSPFAIVKLGEIAEPIPGTGTGEVPPSPQTGDSFPVIYLASALLCAGAALVLFKKAKKA